MIILQSITCYPTHWKLQLKIIIQNSLRVSIYNPCYAITEEVLHSIFAAYGAIEVLRIDLVGDTIIAIIKFQSQGNAMAARNDLQGRCIYADCCQLDITFQHEEVHTVNVEEVFVELPKREGIDDEDYHADVQVELAGLQAQFEQLQDITNRLEGISKIELNNVDFDVESLNSEMDRSTFSKLEEKQFSAHEMFDKMSDWDTFGDLPVFDVYGEDDQISDMMFDKMSDSDENDSPKDEQMLHDEYDFKNDKADQVSYDEYYDDIHPITDELSDEFPERLIHNRLDIGGSPKCLYLEYVEFLHDPVKNMELLHDPNPKKVPPDIDVEHQAYIGEDRNFFAETPPLPHDNLYTHIAEDLLKLEYSRVMKYEVPYLVGGLQDESEFLATVIMTVKQLVRVANTGDYQLSRMEVLKVQCSLIIKTGDPVDSEDTFKERVVRCLIYNPLSQDSLILADKPDPLDGEQTWPTEAEMKEANKCLQEKKLKKRILSPGKSEYHAARIVDDLVCDHSDCHKHIDDSMLLGDKQDDFVGQVSCDVSMTTPRRFIDMLIMKPLKMKIATLLAGLDLDIDVALQASNSTLAAHFDKDTNVHESLYKQGSSEELPKSEKTGVLLWNQLWDPGILKRRILLRTWLQLLNNRGYIQFQEKASIWSSWMTKLEGAHIEELSLIMALFKSRVNLSNSILLSRSAKIYELNPPSESNTRNNEVPQPGSDTLFTKLLSIHRQLFGFKLEVVNAAKDKDAYNYPWDYSIYYLKLFQA